MVKTAAACCVSAHAGELQEPESVLFGGESIIEAVFGAMDFTEPGECEGQFGGVVLGAENAECVRVITLSRGEFGELSMGESQAIQDNGPVLGRVSKRKSAFVFRDGFAIEASVEPKVAMHKLSVPGRGPEPEAALKMEVNWSL